jgi:glucokinase
VLPDVPATGCWPGGAYPRRVSLVLALDLGGTKVDAALVDAGGALVDGSRCRAGTGPAAASDRQVAIDAIASVIDGCRTHARWNEVTAVGIGSAGPVDLAAGTIRPINLPALHGFGIVEAIADRTRLTRVELGLDGTCIALGERWLGAARSSRNALVMVVSTGIGGGIISDGCIVRGVSGNAGHIGQVVIDRDATTAQLGTLEAIASGPATVAWAVGNGWTGTTGQQLGAACAAGDDVARRAVERSAEAVGIGVANAATLLDLELAVIGGGFASVTPDYLDLVQRAVELHAENDFAKALRVVGAGLGPDAPLIGAAALVHRRDLLGR